MNDNAIVALYIERIIKPLEAIIKNPDFTEKYSPEEQQRFNQLLLQQYQELEKLIQEN